MLNFYLAKISCEYLMCCGLIFTSRVERALSVDMETLSKQWFSVRFLRPLGYKAKEGKLAERQGRLCNGSLHCLGNDFWWFITPIGTPSMLFSNLLSKNYVTSCNFIFVLGQCICHIYSFLNDIRHSFVSASKYSDIVSTVWMNFPLSLIYRSTLPHIHDKIYSSAQSRIIKLKLSKVILQPIW